MDKLKDRFNLHGKKALVTGASQGIGKAIALGLAEYGADVMVHYNEDHDKADQTVKEIKDLGVATGSVAANLAYNESIQKIKGKTLETIGDPDILILNASIEIRNNWEEITLKEFHYQVNVNWCSSLWLIQQFVTAMKDQNWGRIITLGSVQQNRPNPEMLVYSGTKMAAVNMVKSLAPELGQYGITINNLAPGVIETSRNREVLSNKDYHQKILSKIPIGCLGEPIDCAGLAILLSSEAGRYISGADLLVDGAMSIPA